MNEFGFLMSLGRFAPVFALLLFVAILVLVEFGRRIGQRRFGQLGDKARNGLGALEGALFGLMGLMIAFSFSGAAARFEGRRSLVVEETNKIGTAWLRLDLLEPEARASLRQLFRDYLDRRLESYRLLAEDTEGARRIHGEAVELQSRIWQESVAAVRPLPPSSASLLLGALNEMFDITTTRAAAIRHHPPFFIFAVLLLLTLVTSLLAGFGLGDSPARSWLHVIGFAAVLSLVVYLILDIEFPRIGLIRVDAADELLQQLRASMEPVRAIGGDRP